MLAMLNTLKLPSTIFLIVVQISLVVASLILSAQEYSKEHGEPIDMVSILILAAITLMFLVFLVKFHEIFRRAYPLHWTRFVALYGLAFLVQGAYGTFLDAGGPLTFWGVVVIPGVWVLVILLYISINMSFTRSDDAERT